MTSSKERREIDVRFCERACMLSDLGVILSPSSVKPFNAFWWQRRKAHAPFTEVLQNL